MRITIDQCKPTSTTILSAALGNTHVSGTLPPLVGASGRNCPTHVRALGIGEKNHASSRDSLCPHSLNVQYIPRSCDLWFWVLTKNEWLTVCPFWLTVVNKHMSIGILHHWCSIITLWFPIQFQMPIGLLYAYIMQTKIYTADHIQYHPLVFDFWDLLINSHSPDH